MPALAGAAQHTTQALSSKRRTRVLSHSTTTEPPGAPLDVQATGSFGSATITWAQASAGSSPVTGYRIEPTPACSSSCTGLLVTGSPPPTTTVVQGLSNSVAYTFEVQALSASGAGPWSSPSSQAYVSSAQGAPSAPRNVRASTDGPDIAVRFDPPANDGGSSITGYEAVATPVTTTSGAQGASASIGCLISWLGHCLVYPMSASTSPAVTGAWGLSLTGAQDSFILHVSCPTATSCIAVGATASISSSSGISFEPYAVLTDNAGETWTTLSMPRAPGVILTSVSCVAASTCVVGGIPGVLSLASAPALFYTTDSGATWSSSALPQGFEDLGGISCVYATTTCFAVGMRSLGQSEVITSSNSGATWQQTVAQPAFGVMSAYMPVLSGDAISCVSQAACTFVGVKAELSLGATGLAPVAVSTEDGGGSFHSAPMGPYVLNPASLALPTGVSCASTTACAAVGANYLGGLSSVAWSMSSGGTWSEDGPLPTGPSGSHVLLYGISCPSAQVCYAAGFSVLGAKAIAPVLIGTADSGALWGNEPVSEQASSVLELTSVGCAASTATCEAGGIMASSSGVNAAIVGSPTCELSTASCASSPGVDPPGVQYVISNLESAVTYDVSVVALNANGYSPAGSSPYTVTPVAVEAAAYGTGPLPVEATLIRHPTNRYRNSADACDGGPTLKYSYSYSSPNIFKPTVGDCYRSVSRDCGMSTQVSAPASSSGSSSSNFINADLWVFCDTAIADAVSSSSSASHFTPSGTAAVQWPLATIGASSPTPCLTDNINGVSSGLTSGSCTAQSPTWTCPYTFGFNKNPIAASQPCPFLPSEGMLAPGFGGKLTSTEGTASPPSSFDYTSSTNHTRIHIANFIDDKMLPSSYPAITTDFCLASAYDVGYYRVNAKHPTGQPLAPVPSCGALQSFPIGTNPTNGGAIYPTVYETGASSTSSASSTRNTLPTPATTRHYYCPRWSAGLTTVPNGDFGVTTKTSSPLSNTALDYYQQWCSPLIMPPGDPYHSGIDLLVRSASHLSTIAIPWGLLESASPSVGVASVNVTSAPALSAPSLSDNLFNFNNYYAHNANEPCSTPVPWSPGQAQCLPCASPTTAVCASRSGPQVGFVSGAVVGPHGGHLYLYSPVGALSKFVYVARIALSNTSGCASGPVWACQANYQYFDGGTTWGPSSAAIPQTVLGYGTGSTATYATEGIREQIAGGSSPPVSSGPPSSLGPVNTSSLPISAGVGGGTFSVSRVATCWTCSPVYVMMYQPVGGPYSGEVQFRYSSKPWGPFTKAGAALIPGCSPAFLAEGSCYDYLMHPELDPSGSQLVISYLQRGHPLGFGHVRFATVPMSCAIYSSSCTPGQGYYEVGSDGGLFNYGDAPFLGSTGQINPQKPPGGTNSITLSAPVVGMALAPPTSTSGASSKGYWEVASNGAVLSFGGASFYGSTGQINPQKPPGGTNSITLSAPVVGMAGTPGGHGYWLVASDGGIFSFGTATFYGSMGGRSLNAPIVGMAGTPGGHGYWLVGSDGGIFGFGTAGSRFYGSMGGKHLNAPIVSMAPTVDGGGYWLIASDGGIFYFGDAKFYGSMAGQSLNAPVIGAAAVNGTG